jgi:anti-sigma factor RsiW
MTVTPEDLAAYADGELAEPRSSEIAAAIGA